MKRKKVDRIIMRDEMIDPRIRELFRLSRKEKMTYSEVIALMDAEIEQYDSQLNTAEWMKECFIERYGTDSKGN